MSRIRLDLHLAGRDLRRRSTESVLLLAALTVAATSLTVGLVLHGQTALPYAVTRAATAGPDVIGTALPEPGRSLSSAQIDRLVRVGQQAGIVATSGPLPIAWAALTAHGLDAVAEVEGRSSDTSTVDRPRLTSGTWLRPGGAVVERAFAQALGVKVGDIVQLGSRPVTVVGIAVSAALPPYPQLCTVGCILDQPQWRDTEPGLVWLLPDETRALATAREPLAYFAFFRLSAPGDAPAFAATHGTADVPPEGPFLLAWQDVARRHAELLAHERTVVIFGSSLLIVLALATVIVLVGGRMADEVRRVGILKAVGASPGYVVRLLLLSYFAVGILAAALGIIAGRALAPSLVSASAGLLGRSGGTVVTFENLLVVASAVLGIIVVASAVPAWRAARTSTVDALADPGRQARRIGPLIALSARLPAPVLIGLRLAARRPRRAILTACSIAVAVCGSVVVLFAQTSIGSEHGSTAGPADPNFTQLHHVMEALTLLLAVMAAVNLIFVTRAAAIDARRSLAVMRALGASPNQAALGLAVAQLAPASLGLVIGTTTGITLFHALAPAHFAAPSAGALTSLEVVTLGIIVGLTALPSRLESRRAIAPFLQRT